MCLVKYCLIKDLIEINAYNREGTKKKICDTNPLVVVVKRGKKG